MMIELSIIIPVLNEAKNISFLIGQIRETLSNANMEFEILLIDGGSKDGTVKIANELGVKVINQSRPGFGNALLEGFKAASGKRILTLDADLSHSPSFILKLCEEINEAELVIASRYLKGGIAEMSFLRYMLSRFLNLFLQYGLSLSIKDNTSGFRLYEKEALESINIESRDFSILPEIAIEAYSKGWKVKEVPFHYLPRKSGSSHLKLFKFAISYMKVFVKLWRKRNSIAFADYDERAYYSKNLLQRYWQRKRYEIIIDWIEKDKSKRIVDIGCGSSKIIQELPEAVAVDISMEKLRYIRKSNKYLVNATLGTLPFRDETFNYVICSEVIEHTSENSVFDEMYRILLPGGTLILGTPDYGRLSWRIIEFLYYVFQPGGYKDTHITRYNSQTLKKILTRYGFKILGRKYILGSELVIKAEKER